MKNHTTKLISAESTPIVVPLGKSYAPCFVNLLELFGANDLDYQIVADSYGVINTDMHTLNGYLCLTAGEFSEHGSTTQLAIRATKADGTTLLAILKVRVLQQHSVSKVA